MLTNHRPTTYAFTRYLTAKRTVDDRALHPRLWQRMVEHLAAQPQPVTLLEIGGGVGTMVTRLLAEPGLPTLHYHLLDAEAANIATAAATLGRPLPAPAVAPPLDIVPSHNHVIQGREGQTHHLHLYTADLSAFLDAKPALTGVQLVIANAFLDLVDLSSTLSRFAAAFTRETLLYCTINFDGATIFQPPIDPAFDAHVEAVYHRTMDERITAGQPSGDSHTGRRLFHAMQQARIQVLDAGSSDWFVFPHARRYPADEAYFLHSIIHTLHDALLDHPEIDAARFVPWIETRHRQIEQGELIYIAHQLDYLARIQPR